MIDEKKLVTELESLIDKNGNNPLNVLALICNNLLKDCIKIVERQPKVGEWIPVSERLPEKDGWYLVQYKRELLGGLQIEVVGYDERGFLGSIDEVIAWQPLPAPYKGGVDDE